MSVDPAQQQPRKRRNTTDTVKRTTPEDDHRRKRRNRTTQSCLNCHTSKRMCDRKRPCGRCTQLGLTGLCVYEVDDPSRKCSSGDSQDEQSRLQKRVAELESVIRELKNKPHPRWVSGADAVEKIEKVLGESSNSPSSAPKDTQSSPSSPRASIQPTLRTGECSTPHADMTSPSLRHPNFSSQSSPFMSGCSTRVPSSPSICGSSPIDTPSPMTLSPIEPQIMSGVMPAEYDFSALFSGESAEKTGLEDSFFGDLWDRLIRHDGPCDASRGEHCGCLNDPALYNVILELSLRLRKAADLLSRSPKHAIGSGTCCLITQNIAELDRFTSNALGNISTPPDPFVPYAAASRERPTFAAGATNATLQCNAFGSARPNASVAPAATVAPPLQSMRPWDYKTASYPSPPWDDSFMSWVPQPQRR
ncbi:uncharacterized protein LAESUDRAFT_693551 [Laetiporus sulphureus 93-53]|uniref:Zn(2)-C6 fungal-type domain-containing protein n=1 Tax=Laetiporus sulphureus 93-53 TaxID=1314785 RepID=A0A165GZ34_9APHY|nr:uncharacterized protein LAESUDRAFT_693551 [Laetiporus sulphureus 93-53]KZT11027.1 hypothetical protein LAESUDRAFT_693551 [Laetiporus sulphureus 93-53]